MIDLTKISAMAILLQWLRIYTNGGNRCPHWMPYISSNQLKKSKLPLGSHCFADPGLNSDSLVIFYHRKQLYAYIKPSNWQGVTTKLIYIRLLSLFSQPNADTIYWEQVANLFRHSYQIDMLSSAFMQPVLLSPKYQSD